MDGLLESEASPEGGWRSWCKMPMERRTADLHWRVVHGAKAKNSYRAQLDPELGEGCTLFIKLEHF